MPDGFAGDPGFPLPILIPAALIAIAVAGVFVTVIVKGMTQWSRNNASPVVTTSAVVVSKRSDVSGGSQERRASTSYFVTFEAPDGERHEMHLSGSQFGVLSEGDEGRLTFQGTRFQGFERSRVGNR